MLSATTVLCMLCVLLTLPVSSVSTTDNTTTVTSHVTTVEDLTTTPPPPPNPPSLTPPTSAIPTQTFSEEEEQCLARARGKDSARHRKALIACLLPFNQSFLFSVHRVRPAIAVALDKVVSLGLLKLEVEVSYRDSKCSISDGMNQAVNYFANNTADVFFGPTCDYAAAPVARQVPYWNKAMVTAGAMAGDFGMNKLPMFPLLTRVGTNFNSLVDFLKAVLHHFHWRRVKLLYNPDGCMYIMDRFCHIAMDAVHHGLRVASALGHLVIQQDHSKFYDVKQALQDLPVEVGIRFSEIFGITLPELFGITFSEIFGITLPEIFGITLPELFGITLPELFGITLPELFGITLPEIFGITLPELFGITLPELFGITLPELFGITLPQLFGITLPQLFGITLPELFGITLPELFGITLPEIFGITLPEIFGITLPDLWHHTSRDLWHLTGLGSAGNILTADL
ncbi:hypothetical protein ACOMHN_066225 [Nucella lapillus]